MPSSDLSTKAESAQTGSAGGLALLQAACSEVKLPKMWGGRSCIFSPASYYHDGVDVVTQGGTQRTTFLGKPTPTWVTLVPDINGKIIAGFSSVVLETVDGTKQYPLCQLGVPVTEKFPPVNGQPNGYMIYGEDVASLTCHAEGGFYWGPELAIDQDTGDGKVRTTLNIQR